MAEFNPEQAKRQPPDWSSASRGFQPEPAKGSTEAKAVENQGMGRLFDNLGRLFQTGVQTADQLIGMDIGERAEAAVDDVRGAETDFREQYLQTLKNPNTPQEIRDVLAKSGRLTAARDAGKVTDTHYWAQLDILSRQIRNRYPAHRDVIDSEFAKLTGNIPANALKRSLESEINSIIEAGAGDSDADVVDDLFKNKRGLLPDNALELKDTMPLPEFRRHLETVVGQKERMLANLNVQEQKWKVALAENNFNQAEGLELAQTRLDVLRTTKLESIDNQLGNTFNQMTTAVKAQFGKDVASGTWNPEELSGLTTLYGKFEVAYFEAFEAALDEGGLRGKMKPSDIEMLRKEHGQMINMYKEAIFNKDTGILMWGKIYNEAVKSGDMSRALQNETLRTAMTFIEALGGDKFNMMMLHDKDVLKPMAQLFKDMLKMTPHVENNKTVGQVATEIAPQVTDARVWTGAVTEWQRVIGAFEEYTPTQQTTFVNSLFGPGNEVLLPAMEPNSRAQFYSSFATQETLDKFQARPDLKTKFTDWGLRGFTQIMRPELDAAKEIVVYRRHMTLAFDLEAFQLVPVKYEGKPGEMAPESPFGKYTEPFKNDAAEASVKRINAALRGYKLLAEDAGADPHQEMPAILAMMGLTPEGSAMGRNKEGPFLDTLNYQIGKAILEGPRRVLGAATEAVGGAVKSAVEKDPEMQAVGKAIRDVIGGFIGEAQGAQRPFEAAPRTDLGGRGGPVIDSRGATSETPATGLHAFIADAEGTGTGTKGYSQTFGNLDTGSDTPVEEMTLGEVLKAQTFMKKSGGKSTAVGRYQFVQKTLQGLMRNMGLDKETVFTPALQDRMALELMKARGLDKFREGKMSSTQFATNLSKKWASLPNPKTGRSYYDSSLNRARVSTQDFLWSVENLR